MAHRFFKLIYVFAISAIVISFPIYALSSIRVDRVFITTYKAKCISNSQYVVLQGSSEPDELNEVYLNSENRTAIKEQLNFYCKYYDEIQPHIAAYLKARTISEQVQANTKFFTFRESVSSSVSAYPELYKLEVASEVTRLDEIWSPIIIGLFSAIFAFLLLQIIRMSYTYVTFGEIVWHPFRARSEKN